MYFVCVSLLCTKEDCHASCIDDLCYDVFGKGVDIRGWHR